MFDIVKSPSGGSTVFTVPGLAGEETEKELTGIILDYRAYWSTPDPVERTPPTCLSHNSLASYLTTYPNQMMHQRKAAPGTMAIVYSTGKVPYLILPRTAFFRFYQSWLKEKGTSLDLTDETAIQRGLTVAGIQFKSESSTNKSKTDSGKKDTYSWRFAFYTNCEENPYYLALPTESLPESIQNLLNKPEAGGEHSLSTSCPT